MNTKPLTLSQLALLFVAAAAPLGAACSSDSSGGGGTPAAGAPGVAGSPGAAGAAHAGASGSHAGASGSHAGASGSHAGASGSHAGASGSHAGASGTHTGGAGGTVGGGGASSGGASGAVGTAGAGGGSSSGALAITSPSLTEGAKFDVKYTCNGGSVGQGINPELDWSGAPAGTTSFAITFLDRTLLDKGATVPMDITYGNHWAIYNIPTTVTKFPEGTKTLSGDLATAKQSGSFLAPCALASTSTAGMDDVYEFTVYALSAPLTPASSSVADVRAALAALSPQPPSAKLTGHAGVGGK